MRWERKGAPVSVRGVASVTSSVHCSQHTSSSALPKKYVFLRLFSKNCTTSCPRPLCWCVLSMARTSAMVRWSISVSRSTSSMAGSVRSSRSLVSGDIEVKYLWKKMVCRMAGHNASACGPHATAGGQPRWQPEKRRAGRGQRDSPFTTSLTQARSAKMSRWYSGRRRGSMAASAREKSSTSVAVHPASPAALGEARTGSVCPRAAAFVVPCRALLVQRASSLQLRSRRPGRVAAEEWWCWSASAASRVRPLLQRWRPPLGCRAAAGF
jgi:hypothetical protein